MGLEYFLKSNKRVWVGGWVGGLGSGIVLEKWLGVFVNFRNI